jgi:prefoldin subunit 5
VQAQLLAEASTRLLAKHIDALVTEQANLAARLAALEKRLARLTDAAER